MIKRWIISRLSPQKRLELYPPLRALRIKVTSLSADFRHVRVRLPLGPRTRNRGGSMFGGAQAALADPIAALACARNLPGHAIWTRSLSIDFIAEGRSDLELRFELSHEQLAAIRAELAERGRATPEFEYGFYDDRGRLCSRVHCRVAIRPAGYRAPPAK